MKFTGGFFACLISAAATGEPSISIIQQGPGGLHPIGRPTHVTVEVDPDQLPPQTYVLEWVVRTPDGDELVRQHPIPLSGAPARLNLVCIVPPHEQTPPRFRLRAESLGPVLAETELSPSTSTVNPATEAILVVGTQRLGLEALELVESHGSLPTMVATMSPEDVSLDPRGLSAISTIIWASPTTPDPRVQESLTQWMRSGGHLVILFSAAADPWSLRQPESRLPSLINMPRSMITLNPSECVSILTPDQVKMNAGTLLEAMVFTPIPPWHRVLESSAGDILAIARPVGHGRLTLIGIDLATPWQALISDDSDSLGRLPAASFWNAVLARRAATPTAAQTRLHESFNALPQHGPTAVIDHERIAESVQQQIAASGRMAITILWILMCWLVCGPILWAVLIRRGMKQYSWLMFAGLSTMLAVLAWLGGTAMALQQPHVQHLSVIDEVAGSPSVRVHSWMDLRLPGFGPRQLEIEDPNALNAWITPWRPPNMASTGFTDHAQLRTDASMNTLPLQARASSTALYGHWVGTPPITAPPSHLRVSETIEIELDDQGQPRLRGVLQNMLDIPLHDISIIWIEARRDLSHVDPHLISSVEDGKLMPMQAWWWTLDGPLMPGDEIIIDSDASESFPLAMSMLEKRLSQPNWLNNQEARTIDALSLMRWASPQLPADSIGPLEDQAFLGRALGADLDLGPTLGTPMLLVTGTISEAALPLPLQIDDDPNVTSSGTSVLRWMLPLNDQPILTEPDPNQHEEKRPRWP